MKIWISILLLIGLCGCNGTNEIPKEQSAAAAFLENKGYRVVSYEGRAVSYELTRPKLASLPYMMFWGLQPVDPSDYLGKTIDVLRFVVTKHPLAVGKVDANVYTVESRAIGGTSSPHGDKSDGGYWSIDGKTLEELHGKPFQEWREEWAAKYGN